MLKFLLGFHALARIVFAWGNENFKIKLFQIDSPHVLTFVYVWTDDQFEPPTTSTLLIAL